MATAEQCEICGRGQCGLIQRQHGQRMPDCHERGYTREHERAEGLAAKVAALEAGAAQRTLLKEVDDTAYVQLRARSVEAESRAEGLAKELAEAREPPFTCGLCKGKVWHLYSGLGRPSGCAFCFYGKPLDAATARVAEMQDRMVAAFGEGTDETMLVGIAHEHEARVAELEKQLAEKEGRVKDLEWQHSSHESHLREQETRFDGDKDQWRKQVAADRALADKAEAELARLRALPGVK